MKTIKLNTMNPFMSVAEVADGEFIEKARELIGCKWVEVVYPRGLKEPYVMIVDEEGLLKAKLMNPIGSVLYGAHKHGHLIAGEVVIAKAVCNEYGECDLVWLTDKDVEKAFESIHDTLREFGIEYPDKAI